MLKLDPNLDALLNQLVPMKIDERQVPLELSQNAVVGMLTILRATPVLGQLLLAYQIYHQCRGLTRRG